MKMVCGIDAQISPYVAGGTETALLSLISALGHLEAQEHFLVIGMKQHGEDLRRFLGDGQSLDIWPWNYSWYSPEKAPMQRMNARWQKFARGPLRPMVVKVHDFYRSGMPTSGRARHFMEAAGPFRFVVPPLYKIYRDRRYPDAARLTREMANRWLKARNISVLHFPYPLHFDTSIPFVYEPWGLPHVHQPEAFRPGEIQWMHNLWRDGCSKAKVIVTATRWVKNDLIKNYNIPGDKIAVIPRPPQQRMEGFPGKLETRDARVDFSTIPQVFALFPAMTWPTKNHIGLLRALSVLRDRYQINLNLICTGRTKTDHWPRIQEEVERLCLGDQVRFLGSIAFDDLQRLFRTALFLIQPSFFEGLGLPLLEAFQHGLPVLASNATCIPEVVGDAALLFDPRDPEQMARVMKQAMDQPGLLAQLRDRGTRRINTVYPNPVEMGKMFVTVYRWAAGQPLSEEQQALRSRMLAR
jgi:glycosyltransferase involved in cell wall biosynthesis